MKIYMGYSRYCGSHEGAVLIFANSAKEAKRVSFSDLSALGIAEDYIDVAVRWIRTSPWLFDQANKDKLKTGIAHVIDNPETCKGCDMWGGEFNDNGTCSNCD